MGRLLNYIDVFLERVFDRIKEATVIPVEHASLFRILFGLYLLTVNLPYFGWMADMPHLLFNPPILSIAGLYGGFLPNSLLLLFDIGMVLCAFLITIGLRTRWASIGFFAIYIAGSSFENSFGKIDHSFLLPLTVLCFAFSNWGTKNAIVPDAPSRYHGSAIALLAISLAFGMFTAGIFKLKGWFDLDLSTSGFLNWFYSGHFNFGKNGLLNGSSFWYTTIGFGVDGYRRYNI